MDKYKKSMDQIHAPESLLRATMERMHEENAALQTDPEKNEEEPITPKNNVVLFFQRSKYLVAAAACVCLILGGAAVYQNAKTPWNEISGGTYITNIRDTSGNAAVTKEEFQNKTGVALESYSHLDGYVGVECKEIADTTGDSFQQAQLSFDKENGRCTLTISSMEPSLYTVVKEGKSKSVQGTEIHYVLEEDLGIRYALWSQNGIWFTMRSADMEEKAFVKSVTELVKIS